MFRCHNYLCHSLNRVKGALVSTVNGELWELGRPIEADCELDLLGYDTAEGRQVKSVKVGDGVEAYSITVTMAAWLLYDYYLSFFLRQHGGRELVS